MPEITPVAVVYTPYTSKFGIPRQSGLVDAEGEVVFAPAYRSPDAVRGIEGFSHLWLIWGFSEAIRASEKLTVRPPRLGGNERVGVFASRSPYRPNALGLSCVRLLGVELTADRGPVLRIAGADMLSGTPVYDIKPYLPFTDSVPDAVGGFASPLASQRAEVSFLCDTGNIAPETLERLKEVLSGDPRPRYHGDPQRLYAFEFDSLHVEFTCENGEIRVRKAEKQQNGASE